MVSTQPVRMCKVRIVGLKKNREKAIEALHAEKVLHIEDFKPSKYNVGGFYFDIGSPSKGASKYSELLVRIRSVVAALQIKKSDFDVSEKIPNEPEKLLKKIETDSGKILEKIKAIEEGKKELEKIENPLRFISALKIKPETLGALENVFVFKGYYDGDFEAELGKITKEYELKKGTLDKTQIFVLFVAKDLADKVREILNSHSYQEIQVPEGLGGMSYEDLLGKKKVLDDKEARLREQIAKLQKGKGQFLVSYENFLTRENEKAEAPLRFGETENTFMVEGFVPVNKYEKVSQKLAEKLGKKIHIEKSGEEVDFAPTMLEHSGAVGSFQFFLDLYSLPFYKELDPTFLIFLTFPLFFGFMLGDIGYGVVTTILFLAIKLKTKSNVLKGLMNAMILASIASIGFGFVFGEFFGGSYFGLKPLIHREHDIDLMILITLFVGIVHMNIGYLFGFINIKKAHGLKHALEEKGAWIIVEVGIILLLFKMLNIVYTTMPYQVYVGLGLLGVGAAIMIATGRAIEVMELASVMSNLLSYTRLFALGLASVALALIVNEFATAFIEKGGLMVIPAILILIGGHTLNVAIGIIGGFLQALRLHYVEFFTKFYKGGGKRYNPFGG